MRQLTPKFFTFGSQSIAAIGKSGSSATARAILFAERPDYEVRSASNDPEMVARSLNRPKWQAMVGKTESPKSMPIIPVRNPIERFRSGCAQDGITAEEALDGLEAEGGKLLGSFHFRPTSDYLIFRGLLYQFPEHITEMGEALGVVIESVNDSASNNGEKPIIGINQMKRLIAIYADDIYLFESITKAGQVYAAPEPKPTPVDPRQAVFDIASAAFKSLPIGKQVFWEPVRAKVGEAILAGDMASAFEILITVPTLYDGMEEDRDTFLSLLSS